MKEQLTYHCGVQRRERVQHIIDDIGLGQVVIERYFRSPEKIKAGLPGTYTCITDTGITLIKDENKQKIITMYVTTQRELVSIYRGANKVPKFLKRRVDYNQSKYTERGKTIWK